MNMICDPIRTGRKDLIRSRDELNLNHMKHIRTKPYFSRLVEIG